MSHTKIILFIASVMLFIVSGVFVAGSFLTSKKTSQPLPSQQNFLPDRLKNLPVPQMNLQLLNSKTYYTSGESIPVSVTANSNNQPVLGFDILVNYDPNKLTFTGKTDQNTQFDIFDRSVAGRVRLTGTKKLSVTGAVTLRDGAVVQLNFQAKEDGVYPLALDYKMGDKRLTNIMNENSEDILRKVDGTTVYVGKRLQLTLKTPVTVPDTDIVLTLTKREVALPRCNDCIEQAIVEVKEAGKSAELDYKIGGIAGFLVTEQEAFGYAFAVDSLQPDGVRLIYTKK